MLPRPMNVPIATPRNVDRGIEFLRSISEFRSVIERVPPVRLPPPKVSNFSYLVRSIVFQQLAGNAARSIHQRLDLLVGVDMSPTALLRFSQEQLRAIGLSQNKYLAVHDLAERILNGQLQLDDDHLRHLPDEFVLEELVTVRGIGPWTAQMFLMHQLRRLDVWPIGDLGVRHGYGLLFTREMPTPKELNLAGEVLRPYRSLAALYCWHAVSLMRANLQNPSSVDRTVQLP